MNLNLNINDVKKTIAALEDVCEFDIVEKLSVFAKKTSAEDIKAIHEGLLGLKKDGFKDSGIGELVNKMISRAKTKGKAAIMRGLCNLERWNKNDNPSISKKARSIMDKLKANEKWNNLK